MFKKFLISLIAVVPCLFINNVKALSTTKGVYPDIPEGAKNAIIVDKSEFTPTLYTISSSNAETYNSWKDPNGNALPYDSTNEVEYSGDNIVMYYELVNNEWVYRDVTSYANTFDATNQYIAYSEVPIYNYDGALIVDSGYGLPVNTLLGTTTETIENTMIALGSVTTALISNTIFQIIIGLLILGLVVGLVSYLTRKAKNRGR